MNTRICIERTDSNSQVAAQLMRELSEEEAHRYYDLGPDDKDSFGQAQVPASRGAFVLAYLDGHPVGCGALRPLGAESAEIKRMYVVPSARRQGVGRAILSELERLASEFGYRVVRLETGNRQPEAMALYERHGYCRIALYGEHVGDPVSICFEKGMVNAAKGSMPTTRDLLLRDVLDDDLPVFFEQQSDASAIDMVAFRAKEPGDREAFAAKWESIRNDHTTTVKAIVVDGQVVGNVLSFVAPWSGKREVGYWIGKEYWGQGIATQALSAFLAHEDSTRPIFAGLAKDNLGSLRVLQKCGFTIIGEVRTFADARGAEIDELILELRD